MTMQDTQIRPTYGYYRQPNGWITVSPATELEELAYLREGWKSLPQYGRVEMTGSYMAEHPLEPLFMAGGAKELPIQQVIEQGMYMNPPLVPSCKTRVNQLHKAHRLSCWIDAQPVIFPQLEATDAPRAFVCTVCSRELPTLKARDQHESVAHQPEKSAIRTGDTLAAAMIKGLSASSQAATPLHTPETTEGTANILAELARLRAELAEMKAHQPRRKRGVKDT